MAVDKAITLGNLLSIGTIIVTSVSGAVYVAGISKDVESVRATTSSRMNAIEARQDRDSVSTRESLNRIEGAVDRINDKLDRAFEARRQTP